MIQKIIYLIILLFSLQGHAELNSRTDGLMSDALLHKLELGMGSIESRLKVEGLKDASVFSLASSLGGERGNWGSYVIGFDLIVHLSNNDLASQDIENACKIALLSVKNDLDLGSSAMAEYLANIEDFFRDRDSFSIDKPKSPENELRDMTHVKVAVVMLENGEDIGLMPTESRQVTCSGKLTEKEVNFTDRWQALRTTQTL